MRPCLTGKGSYWPAIVSAADRIGFWQYSGRIGLRVEKRTGQSRAGLQAPEAGFTLIEMKVAAAVLSIGVGAKIGNIGKAVRKNQGQREPAVQTAAYCQNRLHSTSRRKPSIRLPPGSCGLRRQPEAPAHAGASAHFSGDGATTRGETLQDIRFRAKRVICSS